jgi:acyl carrier protein
MNRKEIESLVKSFLIEDMEIDADLIEDDAQLKEDLGLDSLDFVDIVVIVEKTFGFKIKPEEMANVLTVKDFYDYIDTNIKK